MQARVGEAISAAESSDLTTLSLMGISGAIPLGVLVLAIGWGAVRVHGARRSGAVDPRQADLVLACVPVILIGSVFEGFFLGILSFSVDWIYGVMSLMAFVVERSEEPAEEGDTDLDGDAVDPSMSESGATARSPAAGAPAVEEDREVG